MNGYPDYVIEKINAHKLKTFTSLTSHTVNKCPVYLDMPWLEIPSVGLKNKIKTSVKKCFFEVKQRVIFTSLPLLSAIKKNVLPVSLLRNVVYNFLCHCDSRYVGRTFQRLQDRVRQHVPKFIRTGQIPNYCNISTRSGKSSTPVMFNEFVIAQHLLDNLICAKNHSNEKFTIISFVCSFFHLSALEAVYIKSCKPNLCRQQKFVYNLKLLR